jgi:hypothetical protein
MRLADEALFLEAGEDAANGRRRHAERATASHDHRRHRLSGVDVVAHDRRKDATRPRAELWFFH